MSRTIICVHVNIILDYPLTYQNVLVLCLSEWVHMSTSNSKKGIVFFLKIMKIPTQKRQYSCKCTELSLKRKEGMLKSPQITNTHTFGNLEKSDPDSTHAHVQSCPSKEKRECLTTHKSQTLTHLVTLKNLIMKNGSDVIQRNVLNPFDA